MAAKQMNLDDDFEDEENDYFGLELVDLGDIGSAVEAENLIQITTTELCLVRAIRIFSTDDVAKRHFRV